MTQQTVNEVLTSRSAPERLPGSALALLEDGKARLGLIFADGRIAALNGAVLGDLGFSSDDDLRGLSFASFWHHSDRPAVRAALRETRRDGAACLSLDLSYLQERDGRCEISLRQTQSHGLILMRLTCGPDDTSTSSSA